MRLQLRKTEPAAMSQAPSPQTGAQKRAHNTTTEETT